MAKKRQSDLVTPKRFVPLTFDLIEEGELKRSLERALLDAGQKLIEHVEEYGSDAAEKSKATVDMRITLQFTGGDHATGYLITPKLRTTLPGRPARATRAGATIEQTGEAGLFVFAGGSTADDPNQTRLATRDGRAIDESGNVRPHPSKES